ncbi:hypothetical protein [Bradyrhizobium sp. CCGUVB23]|uniref:hypothetical protein n=1 Tax=Bradyrhizobium sp. CCGUVB23 TaxID=2949630 RepID=UPI0020B26558|nr:hypothetical protein [Bradyrhizobium sp. CCGUVB23]MCP3460724.1 hypothetical protein [Bradyrhizobium sp. CCGUVB23]
MQHDVLGPRLVECTRAYRGGQRQIDCRYSRVARRHEVSIEYDGCSTPSRSSRSSTTLSWPSIRKAKIRRPCRQFSEAKLVDRGPVRTADGTACLATGRGLWPTWDHRLTRVEGWRQLRTKFYYFEVFRS